MPSKPVASVLTSLPGGPITGRSLKLSERAARRLADEGSAGASSAVRRSASVVPAASGVISTERITVPLNSVRVCSSTAAGVNSGTDERKMP